MSGQTILLSIKSEMDIPPSAKIEDKGISRAEFKSQFTWWGLTAQVPNIPEGIR